MTHILAALATLLIVVAIVGRFAQEVRNWPPVRRPPWRQTVAAIAVGLGGLAVLVFLAS